MRKAVCGWPVMESRLIAREHHPETLDPRYEALFLRRCTCCLNAATEIDLIRSHMRNLDKIYNILLHDDCGACLVNQ